MKKPYLILLLTQFLQKSVATARFSIKGGGHQCIEDRADELVPLCADFIENAK